MAQPDAQVPKRPLGRTGLEVSSMGLEDIIWAPSRSRRPWTAS